MNTKGVLTLLFLETGFISTGLIMFLFSTALNLHMKVPGFLNDEQVPWVVVAVAYLVNAGSYITLLFYHTAYIPEKIDHSHPRQQAIRTAELNSPAAQLANRLFGAHNNHVEAFPGIASAVVCCHVLRADHFLTANFTVTWLFSRLVYQLCYVFDFSFGRSSVWFCGIFLILAMFQISIFPENPASLALKTWVATGVTTVNTRH